MRNYNVKLKLLTTSPLNMKMNREPFGNSIKNNLSNEQRKLEFNDQEEISEDENGLSQDSEEEEEVEKFVLKNEGDLEFTDERE